MFPKSVQNDEFLSPRTAPVTNSRARMATCSSTYPPRVTNGAVVSPTEGTTMPPSPLVPAATLRPPACTCRNTFLKYCTPTVVLELKIGDSRNEALVENVAV